MGVSFGFKFLLFICNCCCFDRQSGLVISLHTEAISQRIRIEEEDNEDTQLKYGFFGEVLLNLMLRIYYSTNGIIAKGYFYNILKPEEPKGYDSYHLIETYDKTELLFG